MLKDYITYEFHMIGMGELFVIMTVATVLFGGKKLPEFAKNLGKGIREFKKATQGIEEELEITPVERDDKSSSDNVSKHE